jgi:hypothetical protein
MSGPNVTVPEAPVDETLLAVLAYVNVVVVGTVRIVNVPLNVESTPETTISSPARSPCAEAVVKVATLPVRALLETVGVRTPRSDPIIVINSSVVLLNIEAGPVSGPVT